jgi:hypothetical protein
LGFSWNVRTDQHGSKPVFIGSLNAGRILLVIILSIYSLTCQFSKFSNNWLQHTYNYSSQLFFWKVKEPAKESPVLCRFFHENHPSVPLRFLKKPKLKILWFWVFFQRTEADGSLIMECLKNRSRQFFPKFKEPPNTVPNRIIPYCHQASSGVSVCVKYS